MAPPRAAYWVVLELDPATLAASAKLRSFDRYNYCLVPITFAQVILSCVRIQGSRSVNAICTRDSGLHQTVPELPGGTVCRMDQ
jgi:hypothetical protein